MGSGTPTSQKEWDDLQTALPRGSQVRAKVVSVHPFGVFVDIGLDPRIPVLLEIIHFKVIEDQPGHRINSAEDYPAVGDDIEARILAYHDDGRVVYPIGTGQQQLSARSRGH